ncbi:MAG: LysR family transcriptional regulator [Alphaproteobacteria bacterium]|nr:LysR family transcriptional regulator [Alphaproteobacteria bacterium]
MDAADLRIFEAVARLGSMTRAAEELNTVQSNVTARIRHLEEFLGTTLFDRHSRGISLTKAGDRLLPYATRVHALLDEARRVARDDGTPQGSLAIGALETTAALRLSKSLSEYVSTFPDVDLVLRTGTTSELVKGVLDRRLEGAFVCGPVDHPQLEVETVFREELVVLMPPHAGSLDEFSNRDDFKIIVLRAGCSYRQRLEDILARRGIVNFRQLEFGTLETIAACVTAGLGITLLPRALIGSVWKGNGFSVQKLPASESEVDTLFVRRRDAYRSSALSAFLRLVRPVAQQASAAE